MSGLYALLLGLAQDGGLPQAACDCAQCRAARAQPAGRVPVVSLGLVDAAAGACWLIDAAPDFPAQVHRLQRAAGRCTLAGIVLTHAHIGHYTGLMYLGREAMNARQMPVYASASMAAFLQRHAPWCDLVQQQHVTLHIVRPGQSLHLAPGWHVRFVTVPHRHEHSDTLAVFVHGASSTLAYCPDIDYWPDFLLPELAACDVALLDGTFFSADELPGRDLREIPHPPVDTSLPRLLAAGVSPVFIHLNHSNPLWRAGSERQWVEEQGARVGRLEQTWRLG